MNGQHAEQEVQRTQLVRRFVRGERCLAWGVVLFGMCCLGAGGWLLTGSWEILQSAGLPLAILGLCITGYGVFLWRRVWHTWIQLPQSGSADQIFFRSYLEEVESFMHRIRRTKDISAVILAIAISGVVFSCIVDRLEFATAAWLTIAGISGLLTAVVYMHLFLLELHVHELSRDAGAGG